MPNGYWNTTDFAQIQRTISEVFTFADDPGSSAQFAQQPPPAPQPEPVKIGLGQTTDQVVAALGQPGKVVDLGGKKIYVYKDLKVTFVDGEVSDVQ